MFKIDLEKFSHKLGQCQLLKTMENLFMSKYTQIKNVAVYLGSVEVADQAYRQAVIDFANFLADNGMTLVFGGSNTGMMKLLADTMLAKNGKVIGVFTKSLPEKLIRYDLTDSVITENLAERKAEMLRRADAVVALPGSIGTLDELFDALAQKKLGVINCPIGVLNVNGFFNPLSAFLQNTLEAGFGISQSIFRNKEIF